jgi:hypothetical protein
MMVFAEGLHAGEKCYDCNGQLDIHRCFLMLIRLCMQLVEICGSFLTGFGARCKHST